MPWEESKNACFYFQNRYSVLKFSWVLSFNPFQRMSNWNWISVKTPKLPVGTTKYQSSSRIHMLKEATGKPISLCGYPLEKTLSYNLRYFDPDDFCRKCWNLKKHGHLIAKEAPETL